VSTEYGGVFNWGLEIGPPSYAMQPPKGVFVAKWAPGVFVYFVKTPSD